MANGKKGPGKPKKKNTTTRGRVLSEIEGHGKNLKTILDDVETGRVRRPVVRDNMTTDEKKALGAKIGDIRRRARTKRVR